MAENGLYSLNGTDSETVAPKNANVKVSSDDNRNIKSDIKVTLMTNEKCLDNGTVENPTGNEQSTFMTQEVNGESNSTNDNVNGISSKNETMQKDEINEEMNSVKETKVDSTSENQQSCQDNTTSKRDTSSNDEQSFQETTEDSTPRDELSSQERLSLTTENTTNGDKPTASDIKSSQDKDTQNPPLPSSQEAATEDEIDVNSPLTAEELEALLDSWKILWKDKKQYGIDLFVKFFTMFPVAQNFFQDFRGLTIEEVRVHKKLRAHALSVFYAFKSFFDNLDDEETLVELVEKNARNHKPRGVGETEIRYLLPTILSLLKDDILKEKYTHAHKGGWTKIFNTIANVSKAAQDNMD